MPVPETPDLSFWRTSPGGEVDFIWNDMAVEVKGGTFTGNPPRALLSCMSDTGIRKALILNRNRMQRLVNDEKKIVFAPHSLLV